MSDTVKLHVDLTDLQRQVNEIVQGKDLVIAGLQAKLAELNDRLCAQNNDLVAGLYEKDKEIAKLTAELRDRSSYWNGNTSKIAYERLQVIQEQTKQITKLTAELAERRCSWPSASQVALDKAFEKLFPKLAGQIEETGIGCLIATWWDKVAAYIERLKTENARLKNEVHGSVYYAKLAIDRLRIIEEQVKQIAKLKLDLSATGHVCQEARQERDSAVRRLEKARAERDQLEADRRLYITDKNELNKADECFRDLVKALGDDHKFKPDGKCWWTQLCNAIRKVREQRDIEHADAEALGEALKKERIRTGFRVPYPPKCTFVLSSGMSVDSSDLLAAAIRQQGGTLCIGKSHLRSGSRFSFDEKSHKLILRNADLTL